MGFVEDEEDLVAEPPQREIQVQTERDSLKENIKVQPEYEKTP